MPEALPRLGGVSGQYCRRSSVCAVEPEELPVPVHLYHNGLLPPPAQAIHHVPSASTHP